MQNPNDLHQDSPEGIANDEDGFPEMGDSDEDFDAREQELDMGTRRAPGCPNSNHALQDYQMQLMPLEQENKKRLLMARQEQDMASYGQGGPMNEPGVDTNGQQAPAVSPNSPADPSSHELITSEQATTSEKVTTVEQATESEQTTTSKEQSTTSEQETTSKEQSVVQKSWQAVYDIVSWTPRRCRWDPANPPKFSMALNVLFGFAGAFTVANLYYSHPILNILAADFGVPESKVSQIPTLTQAGYALGLLFLCPLGDIVKRRPFVLWLVWFTATVSIGLCLTPSLSVFSGLSFIVGFTTVTPQIMMPLVGDLAPPRKRAAALSIVVSGLMLGILIARLLSGVMTNYTSWRNVYWLSFGLQYIILGMLWLFMPDYPSTNPSGLNYFKMLYSILQLCWSHPVLVQSCLVSFFTAATFTNFWTTLTFLLSSPPYNYDSLIIGIFALIGIASMFCGPVWARLVIDKFVPLFSVILGLCWCMLGITIGTYTGTLTVAGPVIQAFFNDFGMQTAQIANRSAIYSIAPKARNRVNTAFMVATFCGQLVGTAAGNHLYAKGGWIVSGSYSVASIGAALVCCALRGPWEEGWVGWKGGWTVRKKNLDSGDGKKEEKAMHLREQDLGVVSMQEEGLEKGPHEQVLVNDTDIEKSVEMDAAEDGENPLREIKDEESSENESARKDDGITTKAWPTTAAAPQ